MASERTHRAVDPAVFVALTAQGLRPCRNPRCLRYVARHSRAVACCALCVTSAERGTEDLKHSEGCTERDTLRRASVIKRSGG